MTWNNVTICGNHGIDGVHPNSPDCPVCALLKQVFELQKQLDEIKAIQAIENEAKKPVVAETKKS